MTRIVTWNVNSLKVRMDFVCKWIEGNRPDILCIQETKMRDKDFPYERFMSLGYHAIHKGISQWNGVAVLSTEEISPIPNGITVPFDGVVEARCVGGITHGLSVFSVYVPNGRSISDPHYGYKLQWLRELSEITAPLVDSDVVIAGDFNIAHTDRDVWDPSALEGATHGTAQERTALDALLSCGFRDSVRQLHRDEPQFTWWDYRNGSFHRGFGMRIDLVLISDPLVGRLANAGVDREARKVLGSGEKPSDHAPVIVDLADPVDKEIMTSE